MNAGYLRSCVNSARRGMRVFHGARVLRRMLRTSVVAAAEPSSVEFAHGKDVPLTSKLLFRRPEDDETWPAYRVMDEDGTLRVGAAEPTQGREEAIKMYTTMVRLRMMDQVFYDAQRQGRISFYMTHGGEEGALIGSAAALMQQDMVYAQYREAGVIMWRGFTLDDFADQCFSNKGDTGKGRQMPVHYGSHALNFQTISSPLATQIPQAAGAAYAFKVTRQDDRCVVCYFGDGAASEGDFHAALNFAATLQCPVVFFCRNNGYAISTPVTEQLKGDGVVCRGPAYGMASVRVDGNDALAVFHATKVARELALEESRPVLVEAMTYREGHHSTSDDSTRYRDLHEIERFRTKMSPIERMRGYLERRGWWDGGDEESLTVRERKNVLEALSRAEVKAKPPLDSLFSDVYSDIPRHLQEQQEAMLKHVAKYPQEYPDP